MFGEVLSLRWFLGATVIMIGLGFMHKGADIEEKEATTTTTTPSKSTRSRKTTTDHTNQGSKKNK